MEPTPQPRQGFWALNARSVLRHSWQPFIALGAFFFLSSAGFALWKGFLDQIPQLLAYSVLFALGLTVLIVFVGFPLKHWKHESLMQAITLTDLEGFDHLFNGYVVTDKYEIKHRRIQGRFRGTCFEVSAELAKGGAHQGSTPPAYIIRFEKHPNLRNDASSSGQSRDERLFFTNPSEGYTVRITLQVYASFPPFDLRSALERELRMA